MSKTEFLAEELQQLRDQGLFNQIRTLSGPQGASIAVEGKRVLNYCSNNYLGLANDPRLVSAAKKHYGEFIR